MVYLISSICNLGFLDTLSETSFPSSAPPLKPSSTTPETSRWARNSYLSLSLWTVYRSLKDLLGDGEDCVGTFVQVTVLEIYNEEIYDVLSSYGGFRWPRGNGSNSKITDLPFSLYSTFVVEARHSFNKQMIWLFFRDMLKGICLMAILGPPIVSAIIVIVQHTIIPVQHLVSFALNWLMLLLRSLVMPLHFELVLLGYRETGALCAMKEVDLIPDDPKSAESIKQLEEVLPGFIDAKGS
ncbi:uncharacterized protein LOC133717044 isoform X2 [Rosa rugosa]|uniref:uncharacterized protein LOC133710389 isoform X2 n=1 Tax=Rosa rugosa TaxID=74645 RepID=UPI002B4080CB|nr:uncharacterized protein LOC133710389 isoform X2 [Rosa rugosa]XP_061999650.1 uncharacterized protein LOC133717044 isoform X2 [Rosa rugosa]